jgi:hypothetical protein
MEIAVKLLGTAAVVGFVTSISKIFFSPRAVLPYDDLLARAQQRFNATTTNPYPLQGKIAIVTGATSGLGREIAINLFRVIAHLNSRPLLSSLSSSSDGSHSDLSLSNTKENGRNKI